MKTESDIAYWNDLKSKLKLKYPQLTTADLQWRHSTWEDLVDMIAGKLGKTFRALKEELDMY